MKKTAFAVSMFLLAAIGAPVALFGCGSDKSATLQDSVTCAADGGDAGCTASPPPSGGGGTAGGGGGGGGGGW